MSLAREYRIEALARAARTTVRNVRAYQDRGLLPAPRREGRVALYSEAHLARLRTIGALLERGYSLANVGELLTTWERGAGLDVLLGVEEVVTRPFHDEAPAAVPLEELARAFDDASPATLARAVALGLVELDPEDARTLRVPSPRLFEAGALLRGVGIPLEALLDELEAVRASTERMAARFVDVVDRHVAFPEARSDAARYAEIVRRVRPLAQAIVDVELARALDAKTRAAFGRRLARKKAR